MACGSSVGLQGHAVNLMMMYAMCAPTCVPALSHVDISDLSLRRSASVHAAAASRPRHSDAAAAAAAAGGSTIDDEAMRLQRLTYRAINHWTPGIRVTQLSWQATSACRH